MAAIQVQGKTYTFPDQTTYYEAVGALRPEMRDSVLLVMEGNRLRELRHPIQDGAEVTFLTMRDGAGYKAYERSLCLLMLRSIDLVGNGDDRYEVTIHFKISDGLYCTITDPSLVTEEFLQAVEGKMRELAERAIPIGKRNVDTREAVRIFHERHMYDKEQLFYYRLSSRTNLYELDGFVDYYYGYMVHDTGCLKHFSLAPYQEGFVLRCPTREAPETLPEFDPDEKLFAVQNGSMKWVEKISVRDVGDLNDRIVAGGGKEVILTMEAYHEMQIARIAQRIAEDPRKKIVMIAGPSSSGKTTFSHRLSTQLAVHGLRPHPIPVDNYFVEREKTPLNEDGSYNFECLEAIDLEQFNEDMSRLLGGERVELPTFNFKTGKREYKGNFKQLGPEDILVIEGIHGLNDRLSYALPRESKFKVYISALTQLNVDEHNRISVTDGRLLRRIVRDARTRGTSAADTIAMWPSVRRGEENYIFPFQGSCDVMFNSALVYELAVLKVYAQPLLFGIGKDSPSYVEAKRLLKFLDYFVPMPTEQIPANSLAREFVGGGCFDL